jgi:peptidoglycan/LPS O-acetylase OafA/YrhL
MIRGRELSEPSSQLDELDGLRGLAALIVFLSHTSNVGVRLFPHVDASGTGKTGVYLFFVLSAFLLTTPFLQAAADRAAAGRLTSYFTRRFWRIYPLYSGYLLVALIVTLACPASLPTVKSIGVPYPLSPGGFVDQLLLRRSTGVTWSILVECRYYLVLPVVAFAFSKISKSRVLVSLVLVATLIALAEIVWPKGAMRPNDSRLGPYLATFLLGSWMAVVHHDWQRRGLDADPRATAAVEACGLVAVIVLISLTPSVASWLVGRRIPVDHFHKESLWLGLLWSAVLLAAVHGRGGLRAALRMRWLRYIGFISFSVYLLHVVVIDVMLRVGPKAAYRGWIMLALTVAVSHAAWLLIERPTSRLGMRRARDRVVEEAAARLVPEPARR